MHKNVLDDSTMCIGAKAILEKMGDTGIAN